MRLIDADALLEKENIKEVTVGARHSVKSVFGACKTYLHFAIEAAPIIDAVPVTRCKDCKRTELLYGVSLWCTIREARVNEDDFCSRGERRRDG